MSADNEFVVLRRRAEDAGLTFHELCRRAGIARSTYFRWQRQGMRPLRERYQGLVAVVEAAEGARDVASAQP